MGAAKERPILFSGPMVRAILEGRKTQTRRVVSTREPISFLGGRGEEADLSAWGWFFDGPEHHGYMVLARGMDERRDHGCVSIPCPYGEPGDRLWVRETWAPHADEEEVFRNYQRKAMGSSTPEIFYRADGGDPHINNWRPSIHIPRWASRLTLDVTEVRVQRLQEISEEDAKAEGVQPAPFCKAGRPAGMEHVEAFEDLWQSINGARPGCSWEANPWVWAISFKVS